MPHRTVRELGHILGVWAHPDDEAYLAGGLMAAAVRNGQRVTCLTATRGEAGFPVDSPLSIEERAILREVEMRACLDALGVVDHRWLGHPDGGCDSVPDDDPVSAIHDLLVERRPDTVVTFGPDGMTGHGDHVAVSRWTTAAFRRAALPGARLLYATITHEASERFYDVIDREMVMMDDSIAPPSVDPDEVTVGLVLDDPLVEIKVKALRCQRSQVEPLVDTVGEELFRELVREEFFRDPTHSDWVD